MTLVLLLCEVTAAVKSILKKLSCMRELGGVELRLAECGL